MLNAERIFYCLFNEDGISGCGKKERQGSLFLCVNLCARACRSLYTYINVEYAVAREHFRAGMVVIILVVIPRFPRLRQDKGGGAWCPKNMVTKEGKEYLEVNLHSPRILTSTRTQGRFGNGHGVEYTEEYFVEYWRPGFNKWVRWRNRRGMEVRTHTFCLLAVDRFGSGVSLLLFAVPFFFTFSHFTVCLIAVRSATKFEEFAIF